MSAENEPQPPPKANPSDRAEDSVPAEESRIVIRPGGEVVFENLSELLAEVALELDPETRELVCRLEQAKE